MKKMMKKTSAIAISAFMLAQYIPFTATAAETNTLIIHPYVISESEYNTAKTSGYIPTGTTSDLTEAEKYHSADNSLTFTIDKVDASGASLSATGFPKTAQASNTGIVLEDGYYKITPEKNDTDGNFKNAEAFFIQLPANSRTVDIYPKFTDNDDNSDNTDPEPADPTDPATDKHAIKLKKELSDDPENVTWNNTFYAEFDVYFKNGLGQWEKGTYTDPYKTDTNGEVIIDGLPLGEYCIVEKTAPTGYLLNQKPVTFTLDGSGAVNKQVISFTNDKKLEVGKVISADGAGHTYNWTITADLPDNKDNLISYVITDKFKGIDITGVTIEGLDGTAATPDFTAAASLTNTDEYIITITDAGLDKIKDPDNTTFNSATELKITVASTLDTSDVNAAGNAVNKASISYKYAYNPGPTDPVIPGITDPDVDPTYPSAEDYPATPPADPDPSDITPTPETPADAVKPCTFYISNPAESAGGTELTDGRYDVSSGSEYNDTANAYTGNLTVVTNLAPGPYTIEQIGTASGYQIDTEIKNIYIGKDGNIYNYDPTAAEGSRIGSKITGNTVIFVNNLATSNFNLPFTGTTATIIFTITGVLLMAATGFFIFILLKKRDDDEEEQENH
jgi:fimbrial isopeptide formation D2 family protein